MKLYRFFSYLAAASIAPYSVSATANECRLCIADETENGTKIEKKIPLHIEIATNLNFSRAALSGRGDGSIAVNEHNSQKQVAGQLLDLGGYAEAGSVRITGHPGQAIDIDLPRNIIMRSDKGGTIEIQSLSTDLPPTPRLDISGELRFSFGGKLVVNGDVSGRFRGRIPITVNYE